MKRTLSFMLAFILVMGVLFSAPITVYATSKTQAEAVAWANSKVGGSWDQDGVYGAQCVDLIKLYYVFLGVSPVSGNGCDYATNSLPSGWQRIRYYSGFVPQPGDVAVWTYTTSAYGHVAIVTSADSSRFYVVEQNGSTHVTRAHNYSYSYGTLWGFIRPNFKGTSTTPVSYNYQTITQGSYYVRSNGQSTYNYLTVSETSTSSGAGINAWTFMPISRVQIANNGGNFYTMKFPDITTANAVNVHTSSTYPTSTTKVTNYKYSGSSTQSWGFDKVSGGYVIRCKANENMVLTCNGSGQATISAYSAGNTNQIWTLVPYISGNVKYNANGGSGAPSSQTKYFNQTLTLSSVKPTRSGYTFKGWGTSSGDTSPNYYAGSSYTSESGITLYAIWEQSQTTYNVTYNANGGSGAPGASTHNKGSTHTVPSTIPARFGYTFVGWGTSSTATSASYRPGSKITVNGNKTLYAVWSQTTISETISGGSGTAHIFAPGCCKFCVFTPSTSRTLVAESTGSVDSKITVYDSSGSVLASDDDSGTDNNFRLEYRFQQGTKYYIKISAYSNGTGDIPFSIKRKYTISYNANGGSGAPAAQYKLYGDTITLSSTVPTRSGYTFLGWANASSATTAQYNPGSSYSADANVTLYAVWRQNAPTTYTVSYSANGGSGAPSSQTHTSGSTHTVTSTIPERFGYTFVGWGTSSSATSGYLPGQTFSVTSNRTLYAIWQSAVSFSSTHQNGGFSANIIAPEHCRYYTITPSYTRKYRIESTGSLDSKVTIYNASGTELARDDDTGNEYNFSLDYTFQSGQKYYIKIHTYGENTGSIPFTMKAIWNITYNANGGSGAPSSQEKLYGQNVYLSSTIPQRSGYTFLGWATSANATSAQYSAGATYSAESNATLYAVWKQNSVATVPATPKVTGVNTLKGIDIKWNSIPGAVKYVVYKRLGTSSTWDIVATTTGTSYSDTNAPSAGSYYIYSVKAYNSANTPSNYEKAKTAVIQRVVAPYTKATNATNGINVTWGKVAGANKYIVLRRIGTESTWRIIGETTGTSFRDTNVNVGIYYIYSIRAVNGTGYSAYDINKRFTIQYITAPTAVATNIVDGVNISWGGVRGATKYAVYRRQGGYSTWYLVDYTEGTSIRDYDVENGIYYVYSVRAYNGSGYSAYNGSKTDTIQPLETPDVDAYSEMDGAVELYWDEVAGAKKYNVYRRTDYSSWVLITTTTDTYYYDYKNIEWEVDYQYAVRAVNGTGMSAYDYYKTDSVCCYSGGY